MIVVGVLFVAWVFFRVMGAFGVRALAGWRLALPFALAAMFFFTASAHFNSLRHELVRMVPPGIPYPMATVYLTGVLEVLGAVGLIIPQTRRMSGIALVVFLVAVFPANAYAALQEVDFAGRPATPLWLRAPMQLLFIALLLWGAVSRKATAITRTTER